MVRDPPSVALVRLPVIELGPVTTPLAMENPSQVSKTSNWRLYAGTSSTPVTPTVGLSGASGDCAITMIRSRSPSDRILRSAYSLFNTLAKSSTVFSHLSATPVDWSDNRAVVAERGESGRDEIPLLVQYEACEKSRSSASYSSCAVCATSVNGLGSPVTVPTNRLALRKNNPCAVVASVPVVNRNDMAKCVSRDESIWKKGRA